MERQSKGFLSPIKKKNVDREPNLGKLTYLKNSNLKEKDEETVSFRKKINKSLYLEQDEETKNLPIKSSQIPLSIQQKFVWKKKGQKKTEKITKINEIQPGEKFINIEGQFIFIWTKHQLSLKPGVFQKNIKAGQIYDGSGTIIVYLSLNFQYQKQFLQNGQNIKILRAQIKQAHKEKPYLIFCKDTIMQKSSKNFIFEPEQFAVTVKQLLEQPVGSIRNVMCLVIQDKQEIQIIKKHNGTELHLTKILIYDPQEDCQIQVKLWEDKTKIKFYDSVYLLRGIEVKQYKGIRQFSATKDFTYRALNYSKIQNYLRPLYEERQKILGVQPEKIPNLTIASSCSILRGNQDLNCVWSTVQCNIKDIIYDSYETFKFSICSMLDNKIMVGSDKNSKCFYCSKNLDNQNHESHYSIKMEFSDSTSQFYAETYDNAVIKLFSQLEETIRVEQFSNMTLEFKQSLVKRNVGNMITGVFASIRERYGSYQKINHYLIDLVAMSIE